jgi:hypothetical protein
LSSPIPVMFRKALATLQGGFDHPRRCVTFSVHWLSLP